ncbi:MAG: Gfo/Idh/MocA family oxidoreductase [Planctomycetaceae bacterium]|nr:Gfo/Idh/MocA family oxidoreductase [Planctomycetaceae bacterium]
MIRPNRRAFLQTSAATLATGVFASCSPAQESNNPLEKLNIACIGTANRAAEDVRGVLSENIVALCDVDANYLQRSCSMLTEQKKLTPRTYADYREMIDKEGDRIDAVTVATTDHHHAPASIRAIRAGKHVYCEKPLTHTVQEARIIAEAAAKAGVATQLGTQIHAGDNYRRVVEIIQSGAIGDVTDVHVWVGKGWGITELTGVESEPPEWLSWDLWLGPAQPRPFVAGRYHPAQWRRWWEFGQGTLGDMACHYMDLPFWALKLRHPTHCEAEGDQPHEQMCPTGLVVRYKFPAREDMVACNLTWYDGDRIPKEVAGERVPANGVMFVGTEGRMFADYSRYRLFPADKFSSFKPPEQSIPASIGHHAEWIKACKDGSPTTCNFDYSGALTETVLLGNVAYRTGKALTWDAAALKATNCPEADAFIAKQYRSGWEVA